MVRLLGREMKLFGYRPGQECTFKGFDAALKIIRCSVLPWLTIQSSEAEVQQ